MILHCSMLLINTFFAKNPQHDQHESRAEKQNKANGRWFRDDVAVGVEEVGSCTFTIDRNGILLAYRQSGGIGAEADGVGAQCKAL